MKPPPAGRLRRATSFISRAASLQERLLTVLPPLCVRDTPSDINLFPPPDEPIDEWEWYNRLVGAVFASHPDQQEASLMVANPDHPATSMLDERWVRFDEWYSFRDVPEHVNVVLRLDTDSFEGSEHPGDHPIAWYHEFDGGRAFYTGLGHTDESFTEELFLEHLWGGIEYAMGPADPAAQADGSEQN